MSLPRSLADPGKIRVDLRSDTVTLPPPGMLEAICRAELGDDVYGEDATVNRLESLSAERLGKEAAVLLPSGTMGNLLSLLAHCQRGQKVLVGDRSDIWLWEAGGASALGGLVYHPVPTGPGGELPIEELAAAVGEVEDPQCAAPGAICLETTHCMAGGRPLSLAYLARVRAFADERGLPVHLDGARLFNAALALGMEARHIAALADSVMFCLSKGLAAPVGSMVVGGAAFIARVRRLRKMVGGGMRQAGIIAAGGIFALERMVDRLAEDHLNARLLFEGLAAMRGIVRDPEPPDTNIVFWRLAEGPAAAASFIDALALEGVAVGELGYGQIRAVTHYGIGPADIEATVQAVARVMAVPGWTSLGGTDGPAG
jgi:threonine aldolase